MELRQIDPGSDFSGVNGSSSVSQRVWQESESGPEHDKLEPIAVIGFSLKFPQEADSPDSFWSILEEKRCTSTEWPKDRLNFDAFYHPDPERRDTIPVCGAHFLKEDLAAFDAPFFSITSAEAVSMDPQQRGLLETAYHALENAGLPMEKVSGSKAGVYVGSFADDYKLMILKDVEGLPKYAATGGAMALLANRLSWFFNLSGPSVNLDTACSSSMMALDIACQGLRERESTMALVAGSNTIFGLDPFLCLTNMNFLSPDGRCYSFDDRANGYARGEGFGVVVIKLLSDAIKDGDTIRAVIRSTSSNQDGRTPGITQPSRDAQESLIKSTYEKAGLDPRATRYFEAHGTGTAVGDPTEAGAIGRAFRNCRTPQDPLYVGAVKSNIGHLEGASGIAGLIKTIMVLEKALIPPNANFECLNPKIDADFLNLKFPLSCTPWPDKGLRRASVNSFGFGGANSHAVLDDAFNFLRLRNIAARHNSVQQPPAVKQSSDPSKLTNGFSRGDNSSAGFDTKEAPQESVNVNGTLNKGKKDEFTRTGNRSRPRPKLLVWSTSDEGGLARLSQAYTDHFRHTTIAGEDVDHYVDELAYTLAERRSSLPWKSFTVIRSFEELSETRLDFSKPIRSTERAGVAFLFTGQGAQYCGMGRELLMYPIFEDVLRQSEGFLHEIGCQWSLFEELFREREYSNINNAEYSQPLCTVIQIALIELLRSFNVEPSAAIGHSSGEIAAAYCVGGLSLRSACKVAFFRGKLTAALARSSLTRGAMMAVGLSETEVHPYLDKFNMGSESNEICIACINSPKNMTLAGPQTHIDAFKSILDDCAVFTRKIQVDVAYHSPQMNEIANQYLSSIKDLEAGERRRASGVIAMISSVTVRQVSWNEVCQSEYWVKNMVSPVRFSDAVAQLISQSEKPQKKKLGGTPHKKIVVSDLLEIGPHSALQGPIKDILESLAKHKEVNYSSVMVRHSPALETLLRVMGHLYCLGYPVKVNKANEAAVAAVEDLKALTCLPKYPFDHSQRYWWENRYSRELRLRKWPRIDLLGTPVSDWNPLNARWRHFIKMTESPWVEDHKINGSIVYPASGMLAMAIEGVRQMADQDRNTTGYLIKEATFHKAISIPTSQEGVEVQLCMMPSRASSDNGSAPFDFSICVLDNDYWEEACRGMIQLEYQGAEPFDTNNRDEARSRHYEKQYELAISACSRFVDSKTMYNHLHGIGFGFGPAFQTLGKITCNNEGEAVAEIQTFRSNGNDFGDRARRCIVHPTTLDGVAQLFSVALTRGAQDVIPTTIPTRVRNLWISNSSIDHESASSIQAYTKSEFTGYQGTDSSMFALEKSTCKVLLLIESLETTTVARHQSNTQKSMKTKKLCYGMSLKPDIDLLQPQQTLSFCLNGDTNTQELSDFYEKLDRLLISYILEILEEMSNNEPAALPPYLEKYIAWMRWQDERLKDKTPSTKSDQSTPTSNTRNMNSATDFIESSGSQGNYYVNIGRSLLKIFKGEIDPYDLLFHDPPANDYFHEMLKEMSCFRHLGRYIDILTHKNPSLQVLEIDSLGSGNLTAHMLSTLSTDDKLGDGAPRYTKYDYTVSSPSLLEKVRNAHKSRTHGVTYKTLDLEHDLQQQGFELGKYDLLIASHILHTSRNLRKTLQQMRNLLKPGGKLVIFQLAKPDHIRTGFVFGLLPEWWHGTSSTDNQDSDSPDFRKAEKRPGMSESLSSDRWHDLLSQNSFSGGDLVLRDYQDESCHQTNVIVSTAVNSSAVFLSARHVSILIEDDSIIQKKFACDLQQRLETIKDLSIDTISLQAAVSTENSSSIFFISLLEIQRPFLQDLDTDRYRTLQRLLCSARDLLWVIQAPKKSPEYGMVAGLSRCLRSENSNLRFITLSLESLGNPNAIFQVENVFTLFKSAISQFRENYESDFVERDGTICISRLVEATSLNRIVDSKIKPQQHKTLEFGHGTPLKLTIETPGLLDSLCFIQDESCADPLAVNEIEVEVKAVGLNLRDCLIALGRVKESSLGAEFAGVVSRIGRNCNFKPGDRVYGCILGCFSTYIRGHMQLVTRIPDELDFVQAAALPVTFVTAWHSLVQVARLQHGESILIHSASGGTGQAAIQVAQLLGAEVYVTVGFEEKKKLVMDSYGIPEDHVFYSRNKSFVQSIKRMTHGHGVDVVLNSLSGDLLLSTWECVAPYGRFLEIGKKDIESNSKLPMLAFKKNVSFCAIDIAAMSSDRPELIHKSLMAVSTLVTEKKLKIAQPLHVYSTSEVEQAFRYMQSGNNTGKTVVEIKKTDLVPTILDTKPAYYFDPNATYIIAGGLGGLGRSVARWMARRRAMNLILLSRYGPRNDVAFDLIHELTTQGVHVEAPACDVVSTSSMLTMLGQCKNTMPPVKGCIQATMVLRDGIFETMNFQDWDTAVKSKVQGSWNLHTLLPAGMDFFIMLSSIAGIIGSGGQANYAAGNTYMDTLAHHRVANGEKAVSLDLGWMRSEGVVAENEHLEKGFAAAGFLIPVQKDEFHALLDFYCDPTLPIPIPSETQIVIGLNTPAAVRAIGKDIPSWMLRPMFRSMHQIELGDSSSSYDINAGVNYANLFNQASSSAEASEIVSDGLVHKLSRALSIPETDIDTSKALHAYGVDSLLAVELRSWLAKEFNADVAIFDILGEKNFAAVATIVVEKSKSRPDATSENALPLK